ncbi:glucose-1-phosphate adenylyltransferase family protein [Dissulfurimicrobium hydrothermale]|uniref:glucose-1-phosphate adenylyltransferase family protein n=1 Tax=Dissulfurimicrobium hydrothermale TaxID=1750598 RepID=UPI001EDC28D6|nr:sugar phosphate nucleotidyltransferase [Dissulfurimicrobium hydrothermale]UKL14663.1 NTP transferase domain-containing protein [Dissulfurimicrobium hydrothermale]
MRDTLAMVLAGGVGSRLNVLVSHRAKPAVPFGGIYRIIDFALSNCMNSGLARVAVLTQYKPLSLMRHIGTGAAWDFTGRTRRIEILPPRTGGKDSDWYKGTADAVRQNMDFIESSPSRDVLILSGDHVYYMDYRAMVGHHRRLGAKVTVAMMTVPWELTHQFGIGIVGSDGRITEWEEKPKKARSNLASMGIYVFDVEYLLTALRATKEEDFGHHIIPNALRDGVLFCYPFEGYWRDVGTVQALWDANMDLLDHQSGLDPESWGVVTNLEAEGLGYDRPPIRILTGADLKNSSVAPGCVIKGKVEDSILSPGVVVEKGAYVAQSVVMHDTVILKGAVVRHVVCDKKAIIGEEARIGAGSTIASNRICAGPMNGGLTLIGKWAEVPAGSVIGTDCVISPGIKAEQWPSKVVSDGETV